MAKKKNSFFIYLDRRKEIEMLTDEQAGTLFKALMRYADLGEVPEFNNLALDLLFSVLKSAEDENAERYKVRCEKNAESIRKRWNKENTNEYERIQTNTNVFECIQSDTKHTDTDTDTDTDTEDITLTSNINNNKIYAAKKPQKHKHGEFKHVLLTDDEYSKLCKDYGQDIADKYIQKVDEYCEMKGKSYKNYNLAIRNTFMARDNVKPLHRTEADLYKGLTKDNEGFYVDKDGNRYV